jgi:hypothetical protein
MPSARMSESNAHIRHGQPWRGMAPKDTPRSSGKSRMKDTGRILTSDIINGMSVRLAGLARG